jgi:two-component system chemotaxis response regulator CheY
MRSRRVLVVDDNLEFAEVARELIERLEPDLEVDVAETGHEALALLARAALPPLFIVLDFRLPDIEAPDVLAQVRRTPGLEGVPVLVVSQGDWITDRDKAIAMGAQAFRIKPSLVGPLGDVFTEFWNEHVHTQGIADRG